MPVESASAVLGFLRDATPAMVALLADLAAIESPSDNPAAVAPVLTRLEAELQATGLTTRRISGTRTGGIVVGRPEVRVKQRPLQLLVGHCDTVWPVGTATQMPVEIGRAHV